VHSVVSLVLVGSFAYVATMVDNLFAFSAQLAVTPRERFGLVTIAQGTGVAVLVVLAVAVGSTLDVVPLRWVGLLALAPWTLAWRMWRSRHYDISESARRGALTTFAVTLGLGGDNLAVWIPLLRASGVVHALALIAIFCVCQAVFVALSWGLATHPRVVSWGQHRGRYVVPWLYLVLGAVILFECRVL